MNLITAPPMLNFDQWIVEIRYLNFANVEKFRAIGVDHRIDEEQAKTAALNALRKSSKRDGWMLPPEIKEVTAKRRRDWGNKYALNRKRETSQRAESPKYA